MITPEALSTQIKGWAKALGFQDCGISRSALGEDETHLLSWLNDGCHGEMDYMARHGTLRTRPADLCPGTVSVVSVRMDYHNPQSASIDEVLADPERAFVSRYALGRDYHKLMRNRLQKLATQIESVWGSFGYRAFVDSAPVLEKALARNAGLGWLGKHSNLIHERHGSWFFLGELYTDLPLPADEAHARNHCGTCTRCIDVCPTRAIVAPYRVDARRCISYLTIELHGSIPEEFREAIGNRIYGCDDCQWVCPWNKFADAATEPDFQVRHGLDQARLVDLFAWTEAEFNQRMEGSAIRRIGHERWLRNIAVALGNAPSVGAVRDALMAKSDHPSDMVREHVRWALARHSDTRE